MRGCFFCFGTLLICCSVLCYYCTRNNISQLINEFYIMQPEKRAGTLREQLDSITPALKEMRVRKEERLSKFRNLQSQIQKLSSEIAGQFDITNTIPSNIIVNENDLSLKKLDEFNNELQRLHNEKVIFTKANMISSTSSVGILQLS